MVYTDPAYQATKELQAQVDSYDNALTKSKELIKVRDQLLTKRNALHIEDLQKLGKMLPDNVDNIRLIIDIDNMAAKRGIPLKNVTLGEISDSTTARDPLAVAESGSPVGSVALTFTVSTTYENLLALITDLEHSLRIVDIEEISFAVGEVSSVIDYTITVRTYWLR